MLTCSRADPPSAPRLQHLSCTATHSQLTLMTVAPADKLCRESNPNRLHTKLARVTPRVEALSPRLINTPTQVTPADPHHTTASATPVVQVGGRHHRPGCALSLLHRHCFTDTPASSSPASRAAYNIISLTISLFTFSSAVHSLLHFANRWLKSMGKIN